MKNLDKIRFILHVIFSNERLSILNIVNWGVINKDGKIKFTTKDGDKLKTKEEIENEFSSSKVVEFKELNLRGSLHYWFKKNPKHYGKDIIVDTTIDKGEIITQNCWVIDLMVQANEENIKVKPILTLH